MILDYKVIKLINPKGNELNILLKMVLKLGSQYFGYLMQRAGSLQKNTDAEERRMRWRPLEIVKIASLTRWTLSSKQTLGDSGDREPDVLQVLGLQGWTQQQLGCNSNTFPSLSLRQIHTFGF